MHKVISASNPRYSNAEGTSIDLQVQFDTFPDPGPFTAVPNDIYPYGTQLYNDAVAGVYGPVAPYVPPAPAPAPSQPTTTGTQAV
jgi:hypothetical protein